MPDEVLRPSLDTDAPRRALVPKVWLERPGSAFKVLAYRLRKAILGNDHGALVKAASAMTREERLQALEQFEQEDEIRKGNALPADTSRAVPTVHWTDAYRNRWAARHSAPAQQQAQAPRQVIPPTIGPEGTGRRVRVQRGDIVHFASAEGLIHGKVSAWGPRGVTAIDANGDAWGVEWRDVKAGVHESAQAEHQDLVQKSATAQWRAHVDVLLMSPEARARYFAERDGF